MELVNDDEKKAPEIPWMRIGANLTTGQCVLMEVNLDREHLFGIKPLPQFITYRRMLYLDIQATPAGQAKIMMARFAPQTKGDSVGLIASSVIANFGEMSDQQIIDNYRQSWNESVLVRPVMPIPPIPKNLRG